MRDKKIAYILGTFPSLTTTFIDREILEAKNAGTNITLIAIRKPAPFEMRPKVKRMAEDTKYILPAPLLKFVGINFYLIFTKPIVYFSIIFYLLTRCYDSFTARFKTLLHFAEGIRAVQLLKPVNVDHIHAHFADRAAVIALVASKILKIPYSLTAHANDIYVSPVLLNEKIENTKFATTCTAYNKTYLERKTGYEIELVYHGLDLSTIESKSSPIDKGKIPLILSVGQLKEKKGFPYLIKACRLLKKRQFNFICEIIGEGPNRIDLECMIAELNMQDRVILRGALPNNEVMARYRKASIFVLPCILAGNDDRDGIPNVLLEAMAHHVPVISTRFSGIPEVVEDGITGLLVNMGDADAIAQGIIKILTDSKLYRKLVREGRLTIEKKFNIKKNVRKLVDLLNKD
jgi:glycosyltransferase involved in cell wall biosynthesis